MENRKVNLLLGIMKRCELPRLSRGGSDGIKGALIGLGWLVIALEPVGHEFS